MSAQEAPFCIKKCSHLPSVLSIKTLNHSDLEVRPLKMPLIRPFSLLSPTASFSMSYDTSRQIYLRIFYHLYTHSIHCSDTSGHQYPTWVRGSQGLLFLHFLPCFLLKIRAPESLFLASGGCSVKWGCCPLSLCPELTFSLFSQQNLKGSQTSQGSSLLSACGLNKSFRDLRQPKDSDVFSHTQFRVKAILNCEISEKPSKALIFPLIVIYVVICMSNIKLFPQIFGILVPQFS